MYSHYSARWGGDTDGDTEENPDPQEVPTGNLPPGSSSQKLGRDDSRFRDKGLRPTVCWGMLSRSVYSEAE